MKTLIKTLFAAVMTIIFGVSATATTSFANEGTKGSLVLADTSDYSMLKITGHVKVYLRQGSRDRVYTEFAEDRDRVSFKRRGPKLLIHSTASETIVVFVIVKDLKRVELSDQASVGSQGSLNFPIFQVLLKDQAEADLKICAGDLYTVVNDQAVLKLSGSSDSHTIKKGKFSTLKMQRFACSNTETLQSEDASLAFLKEDQY
ncbi:GIN domain-containing protein [Pedobacter sp.]|uniref:GIN domain-containing protein n=1 Tax=Pedobacter sp. TaxID=1411316 RepID=UPI002CF85D69|nr:DUF2807 domain-containing protein [Pedobacter sp.]HWW39707.1 DUF2807 domain-containing protein [Pedobacter sp.]